MNRFELASLANSEAQTMRGSYPSLSFASDAATLNTWLQICDPNGCHTDELGALEGFGPKSLNESWQSLAEMLSNV